MIASFSNCRTAVAPVSLHQITGWYNQSSSIYNKADYLVDGVETGISLSKDQDTYTLWFQGQVYQQRVLKTQIMPTVNHILRNLDKDLATQKKATTFKGMPID